jgi:tetratricopeptide (TPR) repeat protein
MDRQTAELLDRAAALRRSGRVDEAIAAYEALLRREPDLADSWYNLGWLQRQARRYDDSLASYAEALKCGVRDSEEVHLNRAVILSDHLARPEDAAAELEAALKLKADYLPALLNLGNLREDLGDRTGAEAAYRRALEISPDEPLALSRLAGVVDGKSESAATVAERIRETLSKEGNSSGRADLGFALGRLLDSRGEYEEAFDVYRAANRASRDSFGPGFRGYDRAAQEAFVERMIAAFPAAAETDGEEAAVFVLGLFRSGSTLVEQILAGHSAITSGGELDLVPALTAIIAGYPEAVALADRNTLDSWRDFYRNGLKPFASEGARVTDKRPDNFLHIGLIKTLFPAAKIVHTRRNRLDNLLSLYFLHLGAAMPYALDLADVAHWHEQYERLMTHWKRLYPDDIIDVDYDELVRDPRPVVERTLAFLGLDWEESVLDFHRRIGVVKTASVWQVREPLHARSSGRWKNYELQLKLALGELGGD